jgi:hypothetical protein
MSNTFFKLPTKPSNIRNLISIVRRFDDDDVTVRGDDDDDEQHSLFVALFVFWLIVDIDEYPLDVELILVSSSESWISTRLRQTVGVS